MSELISIAEIFYSIQGEGFHSGTPAIFIRTAGCNLSCDFCDTDFSLTEKLPPTELLKRIEEYPGRFVVLTGGEPTIQAKALLPLITLLQSKGYYISMETNGTRAETLGVDWITVSPKLSQKGDWILRRGDELKLIFEGQDLTMFEREDFKHFFLQPKEVRTEAWGKGERDESKTKAEWRATLEAVKNNPRWRLSFQLHKELGVR